MEGKFEAGTIKVASSAYLTNELPGVIGWRLEALITNVVVPGADPWTTLAIISRTENCSLRKWVT